MGYKSNGFGMNGAQMMAARDFRFCEFTNCCFNLMSNVLPKRKIMDSKSSLIPVEVYLPSTVFRGKLFTRHNRLSDCLNASMSDGMVRLDDVEIQTLSGTSSLLKSKNALINKRQVMFVIDLSSNLSTTREHEELSRVNKEPRRVLIQVESFWVQGDVHLVPGLELDSFAEGKSSFIPLTTATFVDFPDSEPRTFMINREKVNCLMPLTEALPIAAYPALARQK